MLRTTVCVPLVLLAISVGGCTESSPPDSGPAEGTSQSPGKEVDLRFAYSGVADTGTIDQTVAITNPSRDVAAIPTLSFQALDENSERLTDLTITTVFGSDEGLVVAPADYEVFDILRFEGPDSARVTDVEVTIKKMRTIEDSGTTYPEVDYLDASGRPVDYPAEARTVRVSNPGASAYVVRLVGITWNRPLAGQSQQAQTVTAVGSPVQVAASGSTDVLLASEHRLKYDSLKAYISVE